MGFLRRAPGSEPSGDMPRAREGGRRRRSVYEERFNQAKEGR
jgi:hypothetical protein